MSSKPQVYRTWCRGGVGCVLLFLFLALIRFPAALPQPPAPHTSAHTWVKQKWGRWAHWCPEFGKIAYTPHSAQHPAAVRAHGRQLPEKETVSSLVPCHSICLGPSVLWHLVEHCMKPEARKLAKLRGTWALALSTCGGWGVRPLAVPGPSCVGGPLLLMGPSGNPTRLPSCACLAQKMACGPSSPLPSAVAQLTRLTHSRTHLDQRSLH